MASTRARIGIAAISLALLAGAGAVAAANGYLRAPATPAEPHLVTAESVCAWRGAHSVLYTLVPLTSNTQRVLLDVAEPAGVPVELTNNHVPMLDLPAGSGPVLVATSGEDDPAVVGFALPIGVPPAFALAMEESAEYEAFGAFVACPGAPTSPDGVHLAAGSYPLRAGQAIGRPTSAEGTPFNTWGLLGSLGLRDVVPPMAAGSCGSTRVTPASGRTDVVHIDVDPVELVSVRSAAPEVTVRLVNPESADESVQALGGPVLVVVEDGKVVALSRTAEPLPVGELEPGDAFTFTGFEPLVHCETGESLPSGRYEVHVGRILVDPQDSARRHFDLATRASVLVVTERTDVQPTVMARPTMPVCGDVVTEPERDLDALSASIDRFDVIENQGVFGGGGGPGVDNGMIELELALDEPIETFGGTSRIRDLALLRDGVVVGVQQWDWGELELTDEPLEPQTLAHIYALAYFYDCTSESGEDFLVLDGTYTLFGYVVEESLNAAGLRNQLVISVGPHTFEHHPPRP